VVAHPERPQAQAFGEVSRRLAAQLSIGALASQEPAGVA
jgi:hypothetical protein